MSAPKSQLGYLPQLDGIRGLAVAIVVVSHFIPETWKAARSMLPTGLTGVDIFFVLSGFLITGILLKGRQAVVERKASRVAVFRAFYYRRILRIFPIYYLTIGYSCVAGLGIILSDLPWHAFYLSNVLILRRNGFLGSATHLWSLSVEEQFYALWPTLVLATPRKYFRTILWCLLAAGPAFRIAEMIQGRYFTHMLLPACVDLFALGALLADAYAESPEACRRMGSVSLRAALVLLVAVPVVHGIHPAIPAWELARRSFAGLTAAWLISRAAPGFRGLPGAILKFSPLRYVGKVSYGIYLYHGFFGEALIRTTGFWGLSLPPPGLLFGLLCGASVVAGAISWRFIEEPILRLKDLRWGRIGDPGD